MESDERYKVILASKIPSSDNFLKILSEVVSNYKYWERLSRKVQTNVVVCRYDTYHTQTTKSIHAKLESPDVKDLFPTTFNELPINRINLEKTDLLIIPGGNTYSLLEAIRYRRDGKFYRELQHSLYRKNTRTIILGISSGAAIFSPNIEYIKHYNSDQNEVGLHDLRGIGRQVEDNYTPFQNNFVIPHYNDDLTWTKRYLPNIKIRHDECVAMAESGIWKRLIKGNYYTLDANVNNISPQQARPLPNIIQIHDYHRNKLVRV